MNALVRTEQIEGQPIQAAKAFEYVMIIHETPVRPEHVAALYPETQRKLVKRAPAGNRLSRTA